MPCSKFKYQIRNMIPVKEFKCTADIYNCNFNKNANTCIRNSNIKALRNRNVIFNEFKRRSAWTSILYQPPTYE